MVDLRSGHIGQLLSRQGRVGFCWSAPGSGCGISDIRFRAALGRNPNSSVGTFSQEMYDMAMKQGWIVVSMKDDWKRIFAFE